MDVKRSQQFLEAIWKANVVMIEIGPKIIDRVPLTIEEANQFLNTQWCVYQFALLEGDVKLTLEADDFVKLFCTVLKQRGYLVHFSNNTFCVTHKGS